MDVERTIEFILKSQANAVVQMEELRQSHAKTEEAQRRTEETLRRAIRPAVREARAERQKRREMDARLSASQQGTDEKIKELTSLLEAYLRSLKHGGNGDY